MLAPMVRIGTLPMRLTCLDYGADLVYSPELVDKSIIGAERIWNKEALTFDYMKGGKVKFQTVPREKSRLIVQLGTADPELALQAALTVAEDVAGIDVNCGCPKKFSVSGGMGAALLTNPDLLEKILVKLVQNCPVPVSCKIRLLEDPEATLALCRRLEKTGIVALGVHCRTRAERPANPAHWDRLVRITKEITSIPIIANGDIFEPEHVDSILKRTGASSVMIARGAIINPSIFSRDKLLPQSQAVKKYLQYCVDYQIQYQNAKYTLMQMYDDPKTQQFLKLQASKSLADICSIFDLKGYFDHYQLKKSRDLTSEPLVDSNQDKLITTPQAKRLKLESNETL